MSITPLTFRLVWCLTGCFLFLGCTRREIFLPEGYYPRPVATVDQLAERSLPAEEPEKEKAPAPEQKKSQAFLLPPKLPGATRDLVDLNQLDPQKPLTERQKATVELFPQIQPISFTLKSPEGESWSLTRLQTLALEQNPALRKAVANSDAAYGQVIQAGLYPNPTVGYQVDQVQPGLDIPPGSGISGAGQQGAFINQLIKTAGKLTIAQQIAGYDYINSLVAVRKAHVEVTTQVRTHYFALLVAKKNLEVNAAITEMADEVYRLQLRQLAAGESAPYEPLQIYAQALEARNAARRAEASYRAAWRQLAAAVGNPNLPMGIVEGRAELPPPQWEIEPLREHLLSEHTEILTRLNQVSQAQRKELFERRQVVPDLSTNMYHQYDNIAQTYQFGVQLGITVPIFDRNQGNIRTAQAQVSASGEQLRQTQNELLGQLADAYGRYEGAREVASNYRERILPSLSQAYRTLVRRYQTEPDKVRFDDIVLAQLNLSNSMQSYLQAINSQWQAVVELGSIAQLDELFPQAKR
jgi:cobalt-zinc-cadmium efflux system outer membrane protein